MPLKLENKKYTREELEALVEKEVEERFSKKGVGRKGEFDVSDTGDADENRMPPELQHKADEILITSKLLQCDPRSLKSWPRFARQRAKAMDTATSGEGAEWIPTTFSREMIEDIERELRVEALFRHITMPSNPYKFPAKGASAQVYLVGEAMSDTDIKVTASTPGTRNIVFTAVKLMGRVLCSEEMDEDGVVATVPWLREELVRALAKAREDAIINGDTTAEHQDADVTDANDSRKAFKGLRKYALALGTATKDLSTFSTANLRVLRALMGKFAVDPSELAWIVGIKVYHKMLSLDEVLTLDKLGAQATLLRGQLASFDGAPVIVSEKIREDLNASGVYDGETETDTTLLLVNRRAFLVGEKRFITAKVLRELYAETDQVAVVASQRLDFEPCYDMDSEPVVGLGYHIA